MENREVKMVSAGMTILELVMMKDYISQAQLNVFVKEIVAMHRAKVINSLYDDLSVKVYDALKEGPDNFVKVAQDQLTVVNKVDTFNGLANDCPLLAYTLIVQVKVIARFGICQSCNNRIYNAFISAIQSLDGLNV